MKLVCTRARQKKGASTRGGKLPKLLSSTVVPDGRNPEQAVWDGGMIDEGGQLRKLKVE